MRLIRQRSREDDNMTCPQCSERPLYFNKKRYRLPPIHLLIRGERTMQDTLVQLFGWKATVFHGDPGVWSRYQWLKKHLRRVKWFTCLLFIMAFCAITSAQQLDSVPNNSTTVSPDSRFEIIQSSLMVKYTFRVDKVSGDVRVLVTKSDGDFTWERVTRIPHKDDRLMRPDRINYQMFTSGLVARFTFLMNINTGATWFLTRDTETGELFLDPLI
jgi:hypothetical protein